ncbi:TetR/AcrR family transcriptional regulator [Paenibacillus psychroresistens]|uniref:TetR/AcrR family transcriptional regulator n=1 Tax=Paenibacillus psychroresistens TaxID=1778678 RepID=A0A6B8RLL3_9BACL|nr:TetR/AcrR family transcriptional regulator [Paenibacillus psychroresistens]QGQ96532.1 TetR/AcrR family transcriptional regulator [Paenibacillus psychroresistens]
MFEKYTTVQKSVLDATLRMISQKELQATSMSVISKESGIPIGSIYNNFGSKEDIINELFKGIADFYTDSLLNGFYDEVSIQERFLRVWDNLVRVSLNNLPAFQFLEQYSFSPYIYDETKQTVYDNNWCRPMAELYKQAMEQQLFIDSPPRLTVQMHYGMMVYLIKSQLYNNNKLTEEVIDIAIHSCWNSVSKDKWSVNLTAKV